jgi:hypothetical protein
LRRAPPDPESLASVLRHQRADCKTYGEADDKPVKYPTIFNSADAAVITKSDLAAVELDELLARRNNPAVRPGMQVLKLSAKTSEWPTFWNFSRGCTRVPVSLPQSELNGPRFGPYFLVRVT